MKWLLELVGWIIHGAFQLVDIAGVSGLVTSAINGSQPVWGPLLSWSPFSIVATLVMVWRTVELGMGAWVLVNHIYRALPMKGS